MNLLDILFPKKCLRCEAWDTYLCTNCSKSIILNKHQRCIICQKPSLHGFTHPSCTNTISPNRLITIFDYNQSLVSKIINTAKSKHAQELIEDFSDYALQKVKIIHPLFHTFTISSIPITKSDKRHKGFNHSEIIAQATSRHLTLPIDNLLQKIKRTKPQKSLNKKDRNYNLKNSLQLRSPKCLPSHVLLVDDVTTTGATFLEASKVLKKAGVMTIWCLALAQD